MCFIYLIHINTDNMISFERSDRHNSYCFDTFRSTQVRTHIDLFLLMYRINVSLYITIINYCGCRGYLTSLFAR